jgi:DNA-binding MarR family transcriptional regulator
VATKELSPDELRTLALHYPPTAGMLLAKLGHTIERRYTEALKPSNLSPKHLGVLLQVKAQPTTQQALCDAAGVHASKLVGLLNDLEAEGLLVRRRDEADRRRHIVEVSKEGRSRLATAERAAKDVEAEFLAGLDEDERQALHALLAKVADTTGVITGCVELIASRR